MRKLNWGEVAGAKVNFEVEEMKMRKKVDAASIHGSPKQGSEPLPQQHQLLLGREGKQKVTLMMRRWTSNKLTTPSKTDSLGHQISDDKMQKQECPYSL